MSEPWPLVLVKWLDHVSVDPWRVVSDFEDEPHECCVMVIVKSCIIEQRTL